MNSIIYIGDDVKGKRYGNKYGYKNKYLQGTY